MDTVFNTKAGQIELNLSFSEMFEMRLALWYSASCGNLPEVQKIKIKKILEGLNSPVVE